MPGQKLFMFESGSISFILDRKLINVYGSFVCKFYQSERSALHQNVFRIVLVNSLTKITNLFD